MAPKHYLPYVFSCLIFGIFHGVNSVGTGTVVIGKTPAVLVAEGLTANEELYIVSSNDATGSFPVYLRLTPDGTAYEGDVQVFCGTVPNPSPVGYSGISFTNPVLTLAATTGTTSGTVTFTLNNEGRPIDVQCYGVSQAGAAPIQFDSTNSISSKIKVQVTPPAMINFCSDTIIVPNIFGVNAGSFSLKLNEPVTGNNVTVGCTIATDTTAGGFLNIGVANELVLEGKSSVTMAYVIITATGKDITLSCTAQSENGGTQFVSATSADQAIFKEDIAAVKFYPSELRVHDTIFETTLALDAPLPAASQEVTFACTTTLVTNDADIKSVLGSYVCVEIVDSGTANATVSPSTIPEWILSDPSPVFKQGQNIKQLLIERNFPAQEETQENILLVCCAPNTVNQSPKYMNEIVHTLIRSQISPDLDEFLDFESAQNLAFVQESVMKNPAFIRLSPCPCNLLPDDCDIGCCCDANCTVSDKLLFDCTPGIFGGATENGPKDESCSANPFPKPNWHELLCVFSEENPLIGFTYPAQTIVKTNNQFISRELTASKNENFFENETRLVEENINTTLGYKQGISIKTQGEAGLESILTLPMKVFDGKCERNSPVRYLKNVMSDCVVRMSEAECKKVGGFFSARTYAQNPAARSPSCPVPMAISSGPAAGTADVPVTANYYCPTSVISHLVSKIPPTPESSTFAAFDPVVLGNCTFNEAMQFECLPVVAPPVTTTMPHCSFDDGETLPPAPLWDAANNICRNVVVDVGYKFSWSGSELKALEANYVLGDVPLTSSYSEAVTTSETVVNPTTGATESQSVTTTVQQNYPTDVNQKFKVEFSHSSPTSVPDPDVLQELSGNPGYHAYKPIIGATYDNDTELWDANKDLWPKFFVPTSETMECTKVGKDFVKFDEGVSSSCQLHLSLSDFQDCDLLRRYFLSVLDSTMPMSYLSRVGNPNMSEPTHWEEILRMNLTDLIESDLLELNSTNTTWGRMSESSSRCPAIPIGIRLDIMFADSGRLEDKYISRVVNAKISYQLAPVQLQCSGAYSKYCVENSALTQPFTIYSSAAYLFVRGDSTKVTRWEQFHSQCVQEFCKEEAMFPFTAWFQGGTYEESLLWMIAIVCVTLFIFMITRPWW